MRLSKSTRVLGASLAITAMMGLAGCEEEGAGEKAGKKLDQAAEEMEKSMDNLKKKLDGK